LLLGAFIEPHLVTLAHSQVSRSLITICTTLGCAFILLSVGEYIGILIKTKVYAKPLNKVDNAFGLGLAFVSMLVGVWLGAAILLSLPNPGVQTAIKGSRIVAVLTRALPPAPNVIAGLGRLIDPNGFPQVFTGNEPAPSDNVNLPSLGTLASAVQKDEKSVVKIEGQGCGGIVEGSGFVISKNLVATNAHVIAGIADPYVFDTNGSHSATPIWFDPNLDFAVLRVSGLAGASLSIYHETVDHGTPGAVLGYPGGGNFTARSAVVLDEFNATGRNIYGQGTTDRNVYELKANIIPGNSGGPLVGTDGSVLGVVFAESTEYNHVGYALTSPQVSGEISQAKAHANQAVSTGSCAK
ncbi:MAG TPA: MarP family serine protease, partial [Candidatus Saccharimonadales bacterium]